MIKNVIFDFGQVLVRFEPEYMCSLYTDSTEDIKLLSEVVFDRIYWDRLDAGTIENEEFFASIEKRLPERLHETAKKVYLNWINTLPEIPGMRDVIALCRELGFGVYLLSNISREFAARYREIPILSLVDGCIFSAECGFVKPSEDIFRYLCETFELTPEETLFVDDNEKNVNGADKFGIIAYLFDGDSNALYDYISGMPAKNQ
jgi:putative hydrolase of the HAD superfamily